jgi:hypothetical protein
VKHQYAIQKSREIINFTDLLADKNIFKCHVLPKHQLCGSKHPDFPA